MADIPTFNERGFGLLPFSFTDEDGNPVTPNNIWYTITDVSGKTIINDLERQPITPGEDIEVELEGDDLQVLDTEGVPVVGRLCTVEIEYDSTRGSNKPAKAERKFNVKNLKYVKNPS